MGDVVGGKQTEPTLNFRCPKLGCFWAGSTRSCDFLPRCNWGSLQLVTLEQGLWGWFREVWQVPKLRVRPLSPRHLSCRHTSRSFHSDWILFAHSKNCHSDASNAINGIVGAKSLAFGKRRYWWCSRQKFPPVAGRQDWRSSNRVSKILNTIGVGWAVPVTCTVSAQAGWVNTVTRLDWSCWIIAFHRLLHEN